MCKVRKHREGCPRIINVGGTKTDMIYMKKKDNKSSLQGF